jgi:CDGSH-type Zn-finger protein
MRTIKGNIVLKDSSKRCVFCDKTLNHIKKTKEGKVLLCKCGASFIRPNPVNIEMKLNNILQFAL